MHEGLEHVPRDTRATTELNIPLSPCYKLLQHPDFIGKIAALSKTLVLSQGC